MIIMPLTKMIIIIIMVTNSRKLSVFTTTVIGATFHYTSNQLPELNTVAAWVTLRLLPSQLSKLTTAAASGTLVSDLH